VRGYMDRNVYTTSNEESVLKVNGPFKVYSTDDSFAENVPLIIEEKPPMAITEIKLYGNIMLFNFNQ
jgi:hypothetical protein